MRLIETRARRARSVPGVVASVALHAGVIGLAVAATATAAVHREPRAIERVTLWVAPPPEAPRPARAPTRAGTPTGASPARAVLLPTLPTPEMPATTIALPAAAPAFADPAAAAAASFASGAGMGLGSPSGGGDGPPGEALAEHMVDRAVLPLAGGKPRYPEALRTAGVSGRVVARFVVDTTGRVEAATIAIASSTHPLFADAVRRALATLRFRPAEARGRRVRQLAEMPFEFVLDGAP